MTSHQKADKVGRWLTEAVILPHDTVQLTNGALCKVLLGRGDISAGRQVGDDLLADPSAREDPGLGVGKLHFTLGTTPLSVLC